MVSSQDYALITSANALFPNTVAFTNQELGFGHIFWGTQGFPDGSDGEEVPAKQETRVQSRKKDQSSQKDPLEKGMPTHSGILARRSP